MVQMMTLSPLFLSWNYNRLSQLPFHGHSLSKLAITLLHYFCVMLCVSNCVLVAAHFVHLATYLLNPVVISWCRC